MTTSTITPPSLRNIQRHIAWDRSINWMADYYGVSRVTVRGWLDEVALTEVGPRRPEDR